MQSNGIGTPPHSPPLSPRLVPQQQPSSSVHSVSSSAPVTPVDAQQRFQQARASVVGHTQSGQSPVDVGALRAELRSEILSASSSEVQQRAVSLPPPSFLMPGSDVSVLNISSSSSSQQLSAQQSSSVQQVADRGRLDAPRPKLSINDFYPETDRSQELGGIVGEGLNLPQIQAMKLPQVDGPPPVNAQGVPLTIPDDPNFDKLKQGSETPVYENSSAIAMSQCGWTVQKLDTSDYVCSEDASALKRNRHTGTEIDTNDDDVVKNSNMRPDFLVTLPGDGGKFYYDCFAPDVTLHAKDGAANIYNTVKSELDGKLSENQAHRFVINLDRMLAPSRMAYAESTHNKHAVKSADDVAVMVELVSLAAQKLKLEKPQLQDVVLVAENSVFKVDLAKNVSAIEPPKVAPIESSLDLDGSGSDDDQGYFGAMF